MQVASPPLPSSTADPLRGFHAPVRSWFRASFEAPTQAQRLGWPLLLRGASTLLIAPTGSGKTLAAFLCAIDQLMFAKVPEPDQRCRVLYVSPLKALAVDVERNLRAPLSGVARHADQQGAAFHLPEVALRTGDTDARTRGRMLRRPPDILITTPESLYLMLTGQAQETLRSVRWVILDEIHTLVGSKRGAHLALSLERLQALCPAPLTRVGLSATLQPVEEAARFLGGAEPAGPDGALRPRPVSVADAGQRKALALRVTVPVEDMARLGEPQEVPSGAASQGPGARASIWPALYPCILDLIRAHRSTLIFANSRRLAERLAAALNELAGQELAKAHHGSLAREQRALIEDELKAGTLPAMVATSSLELGIDMGAIDLVVQVEAPPSVASGLQRIGRAGHHIGAPSSGVILPKYRGDLLACAALVERMKQGAVEPLRMPRNPLDVLCQQLVAMVAVGPQPVDQLYARCRQAAPFAELTRGVFEGVLDLLSGRYPSEEFAELRPRVVWDRLAGTVRAREGVKRLAIANAGTIPDRGLYGVFLVDAPPGKGRVGELDEEMVFESRVGEVFLLGASSWRIEDITHDRVLVSPAPGQPGKMPFWRGDSVGRPLDFGRAIGALCRRLRKLAAAPEEAEALLAREHGLDAGAARNLLRYLDEQAQATGVVPDDHTLLLEHNRDELGDWRVCLLTPLGGKVLAPWALAIATMAREEQGVELEITWGNDGIVARFPEAEEPPPLEALLPDPDEVEGLVLRQLGRTALFAARFREAAARALLLPRRHPGQRAPLWQQRKRAADLLQVASRYPSFPMLLEAYRECLQEDFDLPALIGLLRDIRRRALRVTTVTTRAPSPFCASLLFSYVANYIYDGDAPLAEQRAQALTVDQAQLRELLGEVELRELLHPEALAELELQLQLLTPERAARHPDGLHELLLRLGDLSEDEARQRCADAEAGRGWIAELLRERRAVRVSVAGEVRLIAAEDAGRYRDALGIPPPPGLPSAFLEGGADALRELVARYARTHGPFHAHEAAARLGLGAAPVQKALQELLGLSRLVQGALRPGGSGQEFCDAGVLRALRQKSLARVRHEVEPVEQAALARLQLAWQGVGSPRQGAEALLAVLEQLQGVPLLASALEAQVLPARLGRYDARDLDLLTGSGAVLWVGTESVGQSDGRVALYLLEHAPLLLPDAAGREAPSGPLHERLRAHLRDRGASFFAQLMQASGGGYYPDVLQALWDLVWAGEVTNDTLQPLRAYLAQQKAHRGARPRGAVTGRGLYPPEAGGRWSLVSQLLVSNAAATATERLAAWARQLLERHGVLTREAVQAEAPVRFSDLYGVLKALEDAGRVRRGYFVSGCGATQFALPGAVERLRQLREPPDEPEAVVLAATDPANPYGVSLPWPSPAEEGKGRASLQRAAGALVVLVDGALAAYLARGERQLYSFTSRAAEAEAVARALAGLVGPGRRRALLLREIDGAPVGQSSLRAALEKAGFRAGAQGHLLAARDRVGQ